MAEKGPQVASKGNRHMGGLPKRGWVEIGSLHGAARDGAWTHTCRGLGQSSRQQLVSRKWVGLQAAPFCLTKERMFLLIDYCKELERSEVRSAETVAAFLFCFVFLLPGPQSTLHH